VAKKESQTTPHPRAAVSRFLYFTFFKPFYCDLGLKKSRQTFHCDFWLRILSNDGEIFGASNIELVFRHVLS